MTQEHHPSLFVRRDESNKPFQSEATQPLLASINMSHGTPYIQARRAKRAVQIKDIAGDALVTGAKDDRVEIAD